MSKKMKETNEMELTLESVKPYFAAASSQEIIIRTFFQAKAEYETGKEQSSAEEGLRRRDNYLKNTARKHGLDIQGLIALQNEYMRQAKQWLLSKSEKSGQK